MNFPAIAASKLDCAAAFGSPDETMAVDDWHEPVFYAEPHS